MGSERQINTDSGKASPASQAGESLWNRALDLFHLNSSDPNSCEPSREYEQYIETAAAHLYTPGALGDISKLEHKYDCQIHSVDDAITYANMALKSIDDPYTKVIPAEEAQFMRQEETGEGSGTGIVAFNHQGNTEAYQPMGAPLYVDRVYTGSPAEKAGIKAGDQILQINGQDTAKLSPHQSWSLLGGRPGTSVNLVVRSGSRLITEDVASTKLSVPVVEDSDLEHGIAYIKLSNFVDGNGLKSMEAALQKHSTARAFIVDVRNNLGGDVGHTLAISSLFVKQGPLVGISERRPTEFSFFDNWNEKSRLQKLAQSPSFRRNIVALTDQNVVQTIDGEPEFSKRPPYMVGDKPVVVLTNGYTASGGEMFTGAVHDSGNATTIGEKTYGKGIGQTYMRNGMPDGTQENVTSLAYLTPSGLWPGDAHKHRIGLQPDIEVHNPVDAVPMSADDRQLNTAVEYLEKKLGDK